MLYYPSVSKAKAHAKFLSKTLKIKLMHAQEAVAFMYKQPDFQSLEEKCDSYDYDQDSHFGFSSASQQYKVSSLLHKHVHDIEKFVANNQQVDDSLLSKIANRKYHQISSYIANRLLHSDDDDVNWHKTDNVIEYLHFLEESIQCVPFLFSKGQAEINPYIDDTNFGVKYYGIYNLKNNYLSVHMKEFDCVIEQPLSPRKITHRKWFTPYVVGYLAFLAKQLLSLGFAGHIHLSRIQGFRAAHALGVPRDKFETQDTGPSDVYSKLIENGGRWCWGKSNFFSSGIENRIPTDLGYWHGVTISLESLATISSSQEVYNNL